MYRRKALYKKKKVPVKSTKASKPYYKLQPIKGEKNGDKRAVLLKKSVSFQLEHTSTCIHPTTTIHTALYCSLGIIPLKMINASAVLVRSQVRLVSEVQLPQGPS